MKAKKGKAMGIDIFKKHIREKRAIIVSFSDIESYEDNIVKLCSAAQKSHVSGIDIPIDSNLYEIARQNIKLPIFSSSIHPFELLKAVKYGVDGIIIGNFTSEYNNNIIYSADEIYDIALETLSLTNSYDIYTCVTIPNYIKLNEQIKLTRKLEILGIDLIKYNNQIATNNNLFSNIVENSKYTLLPIMCPTNLDTNRISESFNSNSSAVEIIINYSNIQSEAVLTTKLMDSVRCISYRNSFNKELIKSTREMMYSK